MSEVDSTMKEIKDSVAAVEANCSSILIVAECIIRENARFRAALMEIEGREVDLAGCGDFVRGFNDGVYRAKRIARAALEDKT